MAPGMPPRPHAQVHVLHVVGCVGRWPREPLLRPLGWLPFLGPGEQTAPRGHAAAAEKGLGCKELGAGGDIAGGPSRPLRRWAMSELRLEGGPWGLRDADLLALLRGCPPAAPQPQQQPHGSSADSGGRSSTGGEVVSGAGPGGDAAGLAASEQRGSGPGGGVSGGCGAAHAAGEAQAGRAALARLQLLSLTGWPWLSGGLLAALAAAPSPALRSVRLERCGHGWAAPQPQPPAACSGGGVAEAGGLGGRWAAGALAGWLAGLPALETLRLRHCCRVRVRRGRCGAAGALPQRPRLPPVSAAAYAPFPPVMPLCPAAAARGLCAGAAGGLPAPGVSYPRRVRPAGKGLRGSARPIWRPEPRGAGPLQGRPSSPEWHPCMGFWWAGGGGWRGGAWGGGRRALRAAR